MKEYVVDLEISIKGISKKELAKNLEVIPSILKFIRKEGASRIYRISLNCASNLYIDIHIESLLSRFKKKPFKKLEGIEHHGLFIGVFPDTQVTGIYFSNEILRKYIKKFPKGAVAIRTYF